MSASTITVTSSASSSLLTYRAPTMSPWSLVASLIPSESTTGCGIPVHSSIYSQTFSQDSNDTSELLWVVLNYATCVPVLLTVGGFRYLRSHRFPTGKANKSYSLYHFYSLLGNTTTIEAWEKDKVATLIRRGKIREVKFPYVRITLSNPFSFFDFSCW